MLKIFSLKRKMVLFCAMIEYTYSYRADLLNVKISMKKNQHFIFNHKNVINIWLYMKEEATNAIF